jgi:hypothetical protein
VQASLPVIVRAASPPQTLVINPHLADILHQDSGERTPPGVEEV